MSGANVPTPDDIPAETRQALSAYLEDLLYETDVRDAVRGAVFEFRDQDEIVSDLSDEVLVDIGFQLALDTVQDYRHEEAGFVLTQLEETETTSE